MERRTFLKSTCKLCLLGMAGMTLPQVLVSCGTAKSSIYRADINQGRIEMPLSLFAQGSMQILRPKGWLFDIAVVRGHDEQYTALLMKCTHMENQLVASADGFQCNLHGSAFTVDGQVRKGPAERPLTHYRTEIKDSNLIIYI